jgi:hypothetical protein
LRVKAATLLAGAVTHRGAERATLEIGVTDGPEQEDRQQAHVKAGPLQVALAVFWSFFGVRKKKKWQEDAARITPLQAIIGGLIGALIFIFALLLIVRMVTG